jgi:hypothetical protein
MQTNGLSCNSLKIMRQLILLLLVMPFLQGCNEQPAAGRFQITAGIYESYELSDLTMVNGSSGQHHAIFKIDTQTGKSWIYLDAALKTTNGVSSSLNGWIEIKDLPPLK